MLLLFTTRTIAKKNEFNNLSHYVINKEILRDEERDKETKDWFRVDRA